MDLHSNLGPIRVKSTRAPVYHQVSRENSVNYLNRTVPNYRTAPTKRVLFGRPNTDETREYARQILDKQVEQFFQRYEIIEAIDSDVRSNGNRDIVGHVDKSIETVTISTITNSSSSAINDYVKLIDNRNDLQLTDDSKCDTTFVVADKITTDTECGESVLCNKRSDDVHRKLGQTKITDYYQQRKNTQTDGKLNEIPPHDPPPPLSL